MTTNRKGQAHEVIISMVIAIVIFGILALGSNSYAGILKSGTPSAVCKTSVIARAAYFDETMVNTALRRLLPEPKLDCKTDYTCLSLGNDCQRGYNTKKLNDANGIRNEIANKMYDCYDQMGSGQVNFGGTTLLAELKDLNLAKKDLLGGRTCVICSQMKFDAISKNKIGTLSNLNQYLSLTKIPLQNVTYAQRFGDNTFVATPNSLSLSKEYAIVYTINTPSGWKNVLEGGSLGYLGAVGGTALCGPACGAGGFVIGGKAGSEIINYIEGKKSANQPIYALSLVEYNPEEIEKNCEAVPMSTA